MNCENHIIKCENHIIKCENHIIKLTKSRPLATLSYHIFYYAVVHLFLI